MTTFQAGVTSASGNKQITTTWGAATGVFATDWQRFVACDIVAQVSGTATSVVAVIERSATNPDTDEDYTVAPADLTGLTGDLTTGVPPNIYTEPGVGWWRVNVTTNSGGSCTASLSGVS